MMAVLSFTLVVQLVVLSGLQQAAAQERKFDALRADLATGTAPIGPTDGRNRELVPGTPIAFMDIPAIGLRQVVSEGTTSAVLLGGPGHRRDTVLPGQIGASVLLGRRSSFGGPFRRIAELEAGDLIHFTSGQGSFDYRVIGVRHDGDPIPDPPNPGASRLLLATADGRPFLPEGVVRVDADLDGAAVGGPERIVAASDLGTDEQLMAGDAGTLWALVLWLQVLIALCLGTVWSWRQWGRAQTWVVCAPPVILVALAASGEVARLLPNLS